MSKNKKITIEDLAVMVQKGFLTADEKQDSFRAEVINRFDKIESIILEDHRQRIERLEDEIKELRANFGSLVSGKH